VAGRAGSQTKAARHLLATPNELKAGRADPSRRSQMKMELNQIPRVILLHESASYWDPGPPYPQVIAYFPIIPVARDRCGAML
jgi:hypothetical protein